jgi:hypothetical protein
MARTSDAEVKHNIEVLQGICKESDLIKQAIHGLEDLVELRSAARNLIEAEIGSDEEELDILNGLLVNTQI